MTTTSGRTAGTLASASEQDPASPATVLLVLQELADVEGPVVAMAFGPGLTLYAALLMPA